MSADSGASALHRGEREVSPKGGEGGVGGPAALPNAELVTGIFKIVVGRGGWRDVAGPYCLPASKVGARRCRDRPSRRRGAFGNSSAAAALNR